MGKITLITGTMFSGKTTKLISILEELRKNNIFNYSVYRDKPTIANNMPCIVSHDKWCFPAQRLYDLEQLRKDENKYIFIDSIQRVQRDFIDLIFEITNNSDKEFYLSGIRNTIEGKEYENMCRLFTYADEIIFLKSKCENCNNNAIYNVLRKGINKDADINKIGKAKKYKLLCRDCFNKNLN